MKKGEHHSEASKRKMSESAKGKCPSIVARQNMSNAQKGRRHSATTKHKISENSLWKGKRRSESTRRKISKTKKGNTHHSEDTRRKQSKIMKGIRASEGLITGVLAEKHRGARPDRTSFVAGGCICS